MKKIQNIIGVSLIAFVLIITAIAMSTDSSAKDAPPEVVSALKEVILNDQLFVAQYEAPVLNAKSRVHTLRSTICNEYSEYCTAEFLNPAAADVDLSIFLVGRQ